MFQFYYSKVWARYVCVLWMVATRCVPSLSQYEKYPDCLREILKMVLFYNHQNVENGTQISYFPSSASLKLSTRIKYYRFRESSHVLYWTKMNLSDRKHLFFSLNCPKLLGKSLPIRSVFPFVLSHQLLSESIWLINICRILSIFLVFGIKIRKNRNKSQSTKTNLSEVYHLYNGKDHYLQCKNQNLLPENMWLFLIGRIFKFYQTRILECFFLLDKK